MIDFSNVKQFKILIYNELRLVFCKGPYDAEGPKTAKIIDLVLKNVSSDMREPLVPLLFPLLGSRISDTKFLYPDNTYKELCGQMAHLVAD